MKERKETTPIIPEISDSGNWYCLVIKPQWMSRVEREIYGLGYRSVTPKLRKWVSHARRKAAVYRPVLSRYLFVDVDYPRQSFGALRNVRGVDRFLSTMGNPVPFSSAEVIDFITRQLKGEWDEVEKAAIPVGAKIKVMDGPDAGEDATLLSVSVKGNRVGYKVAGSEVSKSDYTMNVRAA